MSSFGARFSDEILDSEYFTTCLLFRAWLDKWGHPYRRVYHHGNATEPGYYQGIVCDVSLRDKGLAAIANPESEKDPRRVEAAKKAAETRRNRREIHQKAQNLFPGCTCHDFNGQDLCSDKRKAIEHADKCRYQKTLLHLWRCLDMEVPADGSL